MSDRGLKKRKQSPPLGRLFAESMMRAWSDITVVIYIIVEVL